MAEVFPQWETMQDARHVYRGGPVTRGLIQACPVIYKSTASNRQELMSSASEEGIHFFGVESTIEEKIKELVKNGEETKRLLQKEIADNKAQQERFNKEQAKLIEELQVKQAQVDWEADFHAMRTTPGMVVAAAILTLSQRIQDEYEKTLNFITKPMEEGVETPLKKLLVFLGCTSLPKTFSSFSVVFADREKGDTPDPQARDLASFLVEHTMRATFLGTGKEELLKGVDGYLLIHEWAAYKELEAERNKGGHPNVIQVKNPNDPNEWKLEAGRVARSSTLLKKVVDAPDSRFKDNGLGHFPDPGVKRFATLVKLAASPEPRVRQLMPINLWIPGGGKLGEIDLTSLLNKVTTEKLSVVVVKELSLADVALLADVDMGKLLNEKGSGGWETIGECFMHGVVKVVVPLVDKEEIIRKDLQKKVDKKFRRWIRGTIHVLNLTGEELQDHEKIKVSISSMLERIHINRPSKEEPFRLLVCETTTIDGATRVTGRVQSGVYKPGSRLILNASFIDSNKSLKQELQRGTFLGGAFEVEHPGCAIPVPGALVSIILTSGPEGETPVQGSILSDFRNPVRMVAWPFKADVLTPFLAPELFSGGEVLLQPIGSPVQYHVKVSVSQHLGPGERDIIQVEPGKNQPGKNARQGLILEAPEPNAAYGNYGLTMFKLLKVDGGGHSIAAGQVKIPEPEEKRGDEKVKSPGAEEESPV